MPPAPPSGAEHPDTDRHGRRAVWIVLGITILVASAIYSLKAAEERTAIIRWLHQVRELQQGVNIWDKYMFPNPPIFPLSLYPADGDATAGRVARLVLLQGGPGRPLGHLLLPDGPDARRRSAGPLVGRSRWSS